MQVECLRNEFKPLDGKRKKKSIPASIDDGSDESTFSHAVPWSMSISLSLPETAVLSQERGRVRANPFPRENLWSWREVGHRSPARPGKSDVMAHSDIPGKFQAQQNNPRAQLKRNSRLPYIVDTGVKARGGLKSSSKNKALQKSVQVLLDKKDEERAASCFVPSSPISTDLQTCSPRRPVLKLHNSNVRGGHTVGRGGHAFDTEKPIALFQPEVFLRDPKSLVEQAERESPFEELPESLLILGDAKNNNNAFDPSSAFIGDVARHNFFQDYGNFIDKRQNYVNGHLPLENLMKAAAGECNGMNSQASYVDGRAVFVEICARQKVLPKPFGIIRDQLEPKTVNAR
jgi:hypothetical protein